MATPRRPGPHAVSAHLPPRPAAATRDMGRAWGGHGVQPATARLDKGGVSGLGVSRACAVDVWTSAARPLPACPGRSPRGRGRARAPPLLTAADADAARASARGTGPTTARRSPRRTARAPPATAAAVGAATPALTGRGSGRDDPSERMTHAAAATHRREATTRAGTRAMSPHPATAAALATGHGACRHLSAPAGSQSGPARV
jgi:hypothetical protein